MKPLLYIAHGGVLVWRAAPVDLGMSLYVIGSVVVWSAAFAVTSLHWRKNFAPLSDYFMLWLVLAAVAEAAVALAAAMKPLADLTGLASSALSLPIAIVAVWVLAHSGPCWLQRGALGSADEGRHASGTSAKSGWSCRVCCSSKEPEESVESDSTALLGSAPVFGHAEAGRTYGSAKPSTRLDGSPVLHTSASSGSVNDLTLSGDRTFSQDMGLNPSDAVNILSRVSYAWVGPLMVAGRHGALADALPPLPWLERSRVVLSRINAAASAARPKAPRYRHLQHRSRRSTIRSLCHGICEAACFSSLASIMGALDEKFSQDALRSTMARVLALALRADIQAAVLFRVVSDVTLYASPHLLRPLLAYLDHVACCRTFSRPAWEWQGYALCGLLLLAAVVHTMAMHLHHDRVLRCGQHMRSGVLMLVHAKLARLADGPRDYHAHKAARVVQVDSQRVAELPTHVVALLVSAPLQVTLLCISLYAELGAAVLAGIAIMLLFIPANAGASEGGAGAGRGEIGRASCRERV